MSHQDRYEQLSKIAGKVIIVPSLRGKVQKKQIEKHLSSVKKIYETAASEFKEAKKQLEAAQKIVDDAGMTARKARLEMQRIYKVIQNLDLSNASEVKFDKEGNDVFYMKGGKLYTFDEAEGDLVPYKRNKSTGVEIEPELIEEGELLDTDSLDDDSFDEGFEVNRG